MGSFRYGSEQASGSRTFCGVRIDLKQGTPKGAAEFGRVSVVMVRRSEIFGCEIPRKTSLLAAAAEIFSPPLGDWRGRCFSIKRREPLLLRRLAKGEVDRRRSGFFHALADLYPGTSVSTFISGGTFSRRGTPASPRPRDTNTFDAGPCTRPPRYFSPYRDGIHFLP